MNQPIHNTVIHLCKAASSLPSSPQYNILKSYYLTKCRKLTLNGPVALPQRFTRTTTRCSRCCMQLDDAPSSYRIHPERKPNRFARRLLRKNSSGEPLTRYQQLHFKKLTHKHNTNPQNTLVITCGTCKNDTKESLKKPDVVVSDEPSCDASLNLTKSRKKKRKKDRFSGLNQDVVLSLTPQGTPVANSEGVLILPRGGARKNLFLTEGNCGGQDGRVSKKDDLKRQKKMKGLSNLLQESKHKKRPSATIKQFLTSL